MLSKFRGIKAQHKVRLRRFSGLKIVLDPGRGDTDALLKMNAVLPFKKRSGDLDRNLSIREVSFGDPKIEDASTI